MSVAKWAPFRTFTSLERELQSMLDRFSPRPWMEGLGWKPYTDVFREDGDLIVRAELPGIDRETGLTIEVEDNVLHILGEKREEREVKEDDRYVRECQYGTFQRDVVLPEGVAADTIRATYEDGVLLVRMPIPEPAEEATQKVKIEVTTPERTVA